MFILLANLPRRNISLSYLDSIHTLPSRFEQQRKLNCNDSRMHQMTPTSAKLGGGKLKIHVLSMKP